MHDEPTQSPPTPSMDRLRELNAELANARWAANVATSLIDEYRTNWLTTRDANVRITAEMGQVKRERYAIHEVQRNCVCWGFFWGVLAACALYLLHKWCTT